jgi:phytoene desaturase
MAFTFQNIYVGQSPYNSSALFSMLPAAEITEGALFPRGGMAQIAEKLLEIAEGNGVVFEMGREVAAIRTADRRARGLTFADGSRVDADLVVANADLPYVYDSLLPDRAAGRRKKRLSHACSAIVFQWGMDKIYPELSQHNVFLVDDYEDALGAIFKDGTVSAQPCFYIHAPSRTDPTAAPKGQDTLSVVVPVPHLGDHVQCVWEETKGMVRRAVIRRLHQLGLKDIEDHIKFEMTFMPETWESVINVSKGATFGSLNHRILQMGYFRPHNRHRKYRNLYFAGGSTHPGNGIPLVLLSARLTAQRIVHDEKRTGRELTQWQRHSSNRSSTTSTHSKSSATPTS